MNENLTNTNDIVRQILEECKLKVFQQAKESVIFAGLTEAENIVVEINERIQKLKSRGYTTDIFQNKCLITKSTLTAWESQHCFDVEILHHSGNEHIVPDTILILPDFHLNSSDDQSQVYYVNSSIASRHSGLIRGMFSSNFQEGEIHSAFLHLPCRIVSFNSLLHFLWVGEVDATAEFSAEEILGLWANADYLAMEQFLMKLAQFIKKDWRSIFQRDATKIKTRKFASLQFTQKVFDIIAFAENAENLAFIDTMATIGEWDIQKELPDFQRWLSESMFSSEPLTWKDFASFSVLQESPIWELIPGKDIFKAAKVELDSVVARIFEDELTCKQCGMTLPRVAFATATCAYLGHTGRYTSGYNPGW
eukprot:CAMPEP_0117779902 /NCGR_PEP_ID=MMETSP0948-20121206/1902_1 /TAXON_ID=44440 /ORGANISM="Chattonella subsalsa, Strain CCMP2191" /LENGTH=364 /DNA_ID=CAMNT_0005607581 /DNA_START=260 /DNA_END=1351 /DNA_ORIENTATION=+